MPRRPGRLYQLVAMEVKAAAWRAEMRRARVRVVDVPSLKEVHVVIGRRVFSVKVAERQWWITPRQLLGYARSLLSHGKEHGRVVHPILLVYRLTGGALRLAARLRWIRIIPYRSMGLRAIIYWLFDKLVELIAEAIRWMRQHGQPTTWLQLLLEEAEKQQRRMSS